MEPVVHGVGINPEGESATVNQRLVVLRPVGDGVKRLAHGCRLERNGGDQITAFSVNAIPTASIWATMPVGSAPAAVTSPEAQRASARCTVMSRMGKRAPEPVRAARPNARLRSSRKTVRLTSS
jgi:hypothetical protein